VVAPPDTDLHGPGSPALPLSHLAGSTCAGVPSGEDARADTFIQARAPIASRRDGERHARIWPTCP